MGQAQPEIAVAPADYPCALRDRGQKEHGGRVLVNNCEGPEELQLTCTGAAGSTTIPARIAVASAGFTTGGLVSLGSCPLDHGGFSSSSRCWCGIFRVRNVRAQQQDQQDNSGRLPHSRDYTLRTYPGPVPAPV